MKEKIRFFIGRIKAGRLGEMRRQTLWISQYARRYWLTIVFYTLLGMVGTVVALLTSLVSKDLVDIITGHQTGEIIKTFSIMIGLNVGTTFLNQISEYASTYLSLKVDSEIKADIFSKILVTDWESLTTYHTGDLLTRWGSDASAISNGILNFIPNAIIYVFRFISAFAMVIYYDASFAVFAFLGMPVSLLITWASRGVAREKVVAVPASMANTATRSMAFPASPSTRLPRSARQDSEYFCRFLLRTWIMKPKAVPSTM